MSILFGGASKVNQPKPETTLRINTAVYGLVRPFGAGQRRLPWNLTGFWDFASQAHQQSGGKGGLVGGGGKGGGKGGGVTYTYSAAVMGGICEGPVYAVGTVWDSDGSQVSLSSKNLTAFTGSYSQAAWSYLTSKHSSQADPNRGLCYCAAGPMQLGSSPALPNLTFEVTFAINGAATGFTDAHPYDHLIDYLTNEYYGLGFPSEYLDDMTQWFDYCQASGIFISPAYQSAQAASQHIQDLMDMTNSEIVWNGGKLRVVPYGDQAVTGYTATYTPPSQAFYSLGEDDLLPNQGASSSSTSSADTIDPIVITIKPNSQSNNIIKVQFNERINNYNPQVVDAKDDGDIAMTQERPADVKTFDAICVRSVAMTVAHNLLARQAYRNQPIITVGPEYMLLDPMDLIEATNEALAMDNQWLRIKDITRNADRSFIFECEEYLYGTGSTPVFGSEAGSGYVANNSVDPGDASAPVLINPPSTLTQGALEAWIAVSGTDSNWGGCDVHISLDGSSYSKVGTVNGASRYGTLLADLATGSDPDEVNSFDVDMSASLGQISGGSQEDVDGFATLAIIDDELIAYRDVTMVSTYEFTGSYLRRGAYGTTIAAHTTGASFVRLDNNIFKYPYTTAQKGTTIYVKLPSFNIFGGGLQDLSAVTEYSVVLGLAETVPDKVTGLALSHTFGGNSLDLVWLPSNGAQEYIVNIYKDDGTTLLRTATVTGLNFSYTASQAALDGVQRAYKITVQATNTVGDATVSDVLSASNSAPAALSGVTSGSIGTGTATLSCTASGDSDLEGYTVFFSTTSGFDPSTQGSVASSAGPLVSLYGLGAATYYYKMAAYDSWSSNPAFLNLSTEQSFTISSGGGSTPTGGGGGSGSGGYATRGKNASY